MWCKKWKQARVELGQAQVKLEAIDEAVVDVGVELGKKTRPLLCLI